MRIGVVSDIHGNWPAFSAVMAEMDRLKVDKIICLGDVVNPLPSSRRVLEYLINNDIPLLRGNHEDYIISALEDPANKINHLPQFRPIHIVSKLFDSSFIEILKALPMTLQIPSSLAGDVLFCHASPKSNNSGWLYGINDDLGRELSAETANTIVCGHWHNPDTTIWNQKKLIMNGSTGLPLAGKMAAEFLILEETPNGWNHQHLTVPYNFQETIEEYVQSGWLVQGGPMAWILFCEFSTATRQVSRFFQYLHTQQVSHTNEEDFSIAAETFLRQNDNWNVVKPFLS